MSNADDRCAYDYAARTCLGSRGDHENHPRGHAFVEPPQPAPCPRCGDELPASMCQPQPAPMRLSTPVPLPWGMPTLSREDARIARERINPAPRWPSQPEPDKVIASCEAGIDECSFECQQYGQRHTPENAGTACPTDQTVDVPQPEPSGDEAKVRADLVALANRHWAGIGGDETWEALKAAVRAAYAAGKADGAREERANSNKGCPVWCTFIDGNHTGPCSRETHEDFIARRGSEGK